MLFFIPVISFSQTNDNPKTAKNIESFIPEDYDTLMVVRGDLNKDKKKDVVLVLRHEMEKKADIENTDTDGIASRILVVLLRKDNLYELSVASGAVILCKHCGGIMGDPFESVRIEMGLLVVKHYGGSAWRWGFTHKFRYQKNSFFLIGQTSISYWNVEMCEKLGEFAATQYEDINFVTGAYVKKKVSEQGCKLLENKKGKQKIQPLKSLGEFTIEN